MHITEGVQPDREFASLDHHGACDFGLHCYAVVLDISAQSALSGEP